MSTQQTTIKKPRSRWYTVISLSSAALVDSMEGFGLEILWPHMYRSLGLLVTQLAPLLSLGKVINTLTTPLWGFIADRYSRRTVLIIMTGMWGLWTALTGFVQEFWQLMAIRVCSSFGLAVLYPAALSIISDLFNREERGRAIGVMGAAGFAGSMVSTVVLSTLAISNPEAWRYGFMLVGLLSFITGIMLIFIKEPVRGAMEPELADVVTSATALKFEFKKLPILMKIPTWWVLMVDEIVDWVGFSVLTAWAFTWLDTLKLGEGVPLAMLMLFVGTILGHLVFGWVSDLVDKKHPNHGRVTLGQIGLVIHFLSVAGFLILGGRSIINLLITGLFVGVTFSLKETGSRIPLLQNILLPEVRATGRSFIEMVKGLVTAGGITFSGWVLAQLGNDLQTMMLIMVPTTTLAASLIWIAMFRTYPRDMAKVKRILTQERKNILDQA